MLFLFCSPSLSLWKRLSLNCEEWEGCTSKAVFPRKVPRNQKRKDTTPSIESSLYFCCRFVMKLWDEYTLGIPHMCTMNKNQLILMSVGLGFLLLFGLTQCLSKSQLISSVYEEVILDRSERVDLHECWLSMESLYV